MVPCTDIVWLNEIKLHHILNLINNLFYSSIRNQLTPLSSERYIKAAADTGGNCTFPILVILDTKALSCRMRSYLLFS